jgi:branched-chain amino acid transport system substrate-binding protein
MRSVLSAGLAALAVAIAGCEKKAASPPATSGRATTSTPGHGPGGDTILIGEVGSLTGAEATKFAKDNLKFNRVAVLRDLASDYSQGLADVFEGRFTEMGGKVVSRETYSKGSTDFRSQLIAIKRAQPEAIYIPGYYTDIGVIARQARELGITAKLMGGDGWDSPKLFELGSSAVEGSFFSDHYSPDDPNPRIQKFIADYRAAYGSVPDAVAALGYDAAMVAVDAMKRAPSLDRESVRTAIAQTRNFPGVTGTITLDEKRNATKPAVVLEVGAGKIRYVASISP